MRLLIALNVFQGCPEKSLRLLMALRVSRVSLELNEFPHGFYSLLRNRERSLQKSMRLVLALGVFQMSFKNSMALLMVLRVSQVSLKRLMRLLIAFKVS